MAVCAIESITVEPYEDGATFGETGPYEVVRGVLRYAVDPTTGASRRIVDLDRVPRDANGLVAFESDLVVVRPVDPGAGNRGLLYSVANRGSMPSLPLSVGAFAIPGLSDHIEPGDGFLLRRGYSVAWSGWQWDVVRRAGMVGLAAPEALGDDDRPIAGPVRVRVQPPTASEIVRLAGLALDPNLAPPLPYPPADLDDPDATLTVQDAPEDRGIPIGRTSWRFTDGEHIALDGGFEAGRIYEVVYRTARCPVVGVGFLAVRDAVSWLRRADASDGNPLAGRVEFALATGASQSGRFLRHFLSEGMNVDDIGNRVFDGVHIHIAGGRRGEFNCRYGQPGVIWRGPGDVPRFTTTALLEPQRAVGGVPKVVATNSAAEYWRGDAWLAHGDAVARSDVDDAPDVRHYLLAGVDHLGEVGAFAAAMIPAVNPPNGLSAVALERAIFVTLEPWVRDGVEPPPSRVPRLDDGTAIDRAEALARFAARPDVRVPTLDALPGGGDDAPAVIVSALDEHGNEIAGVRLPQLVEPVAAYTGWNVRPPIDGLPDLMPDFLGSRLPCTGPPPERYAGRADYEARVGAAARELVEERFLLPEDVDLVVGDALRGYDETVSGH